MFLKIYIDIFEMSLFREPISSYEYFNKNNKKIAYFVKGECRDSVNKW